MSGWKTIFPGLIAVGVAWTPILASSTEASGPADDSVQTEGQDAGAGAIAGGQGFAVAGTGMVVAPEEAPPDAGAPMLASAGPAFGPVGGSGGSLMQEALRPALGALQRIAAGPAKGGGPLQAKVLARAAIVARQINSTGGYRFDGVNDCYGFVRRVWNPILASRKLPDLPVSDYPSRAWAPITSWRALAPGDVLATHQGHMWGPHWHGGLFAGMRGGTPTVFDDTPSRGASIHPDEVFRYYYLPTHALLSGAP